MAFLVHRHFILWQKLSSNSPSECDETVVNRQTTDTSAEDELHVHRRGAYQRNLNDSSSADHLVSSVWCWGHDHSERTCRFHNLFYLPGEDEFVFLHGERSIYVGLPLNRFDPTLLDLSSVRNHNRNYFNYVDMLSSKARHITSGVHVIHERSIIFNRFHPFNLMHVMHDDLLPLHHTLVTSEAQLTSGNFEFLENGFPVQIVLMDDSNPGPFRHLYELFSSVLPLYKRDLRRLRAPVCFSNVVVGISKHTTWYQYGFTEPQGALDDSEVNAWDIRRFGSFVKRRLNIEASNEHALLGETIVLMTRKSNRLILNEFNLTLSLAQAFQMKVVTMSMETHSLADMITAVSSATLLIGMHGSLLSLALFLPSGAMLVELFPYAVNPDHYTPYRTLVSLAGMDVQYVAWRNWDVENSVAHPDRTWDQGGIAHLSSAEQKRILGSSEVPRHLCCREPEWLFRVYQDTVVDINGLVLLIRSKRNLRSSISPEKQLLRSSVQSHRVFPSYVINIACSYDANEPEMLFISWSPPTNLDYIGYDAVRYEVWIQEEDADDYMAWILSATSHLFSSKDMKQSTNYNIWVRCLTDDLTGPFNSQNVICSTGSVIEDK